jgi:MFS family permease
MSKQKDNLSNPEKKVITLLGLPSFGLALSSTVVVTYVPLLARQFTSSTAIVGGIIAVEGLVALFLPVLAGVWSDHLETRVGGRLPFLIAGLPLSVFALIALGISKGLTELIIFTGIFFVAYYLAYEPYRALYPDLVEDAAAGRAQSLQAVWRGIGTGVALTAGGFLLAAAVWLPFIMAAVLVTLSSAIFIALMLKRNAIPKQKADVNETIKESYVDAWYQLRKNVPLRNFIVANALWELTLAALKSFIILYLTVGLGKSRAIAATLISITSIIMFLAAPISGKLGDKYGTIKVSRFGAFVFGIGLLFPAFTHSPWLILPIMPIAALGGAIVLTLPYAILIPMMPKGQHGKLTGLYSTSRGIGIMLGPLLTGFAIAIFKNTLPAKGYSAMWLICAIAMLLSVIPVNRIIKMTSLS